MQNVRRPVCNWIHNHDKEFSTELDGNVIYDYMLANTDPENVFFQLDLYWIAEGGGVATDYFTNNPGRFLCYHIKIRKEAGARNGFPVKL